VKTFRHALALDERRARFRPSIWNEPSVEGEELDDEPVIKSRGDTPRDQWVYEPPNRDSTDVKEVWFAGSLDPAHKSSDFQLLSLTKP
jgi:hypothetical protein